MCFPVKLDSFCIPHTQPNKKRRGVLKEDIPGVLVEDEAVILDSDAPHQAGHALTTMGIRLT